jgi:hypothetical protein
MSYGDRRCGRRAARQALHQLHAARRLGAEERAMRTAAIVTGYLQERMDMPIAEPTPQEIAAFFAQHACSPVLCEQAVRFFQACDNARFLPSDQAMSRDLPDAAGGFILAVEEELCPTLSS